MKNDLIRCKKTNKNASKSAHLFPLHGSSVIEWKEWSSKFAILYQYRCNYSIRKGNASMLFSQVLNGNQFIKGVRPVSWNSWLFNFTSHFQLILNSQFLLYFVSNFLTMSLSFFPLICNCFVSDCIAILLAYMHIWSLHHRLLPIIGDPNLFGSPGYWIYTDSLWLASLPSHFHIMAADLEAVFGTQH